MIVLDKHGRPVERLYLDKRPRTAGNTVRFLRAMTSEASDERDGAPTVLTVAIEHVALSRKRRAKDLPNVPAGYQECVPIGELDNPELFERIDE